MPNAFTVTATSQTPGVTFLQLTLDMQDVPLQRDSSGNISGTKVMTLPNQFTGDVTIKALLPTDWTLSLSIRTVPDKTSVFKQDITGTIDDSLKDEWNGTLTLSPPSGSITSAPKPAAPAKSTPEAQTDKTAGHGRTK